MAKTTTKQRRGFFQQITLDFLLGLGLFAIVAFAGTKLAGNQRADDQQIFTSTAFAAAPHANWGLTQGFEPTAAVERTTGGSENTFILGLAFACVFALDMGLFRHLRRVYASPR